MSEGAPYRHNNEKYIAFAFFPTHTHFRNLIRRLSRPATFCTCFNCVAQFCFTGSSCWLTTYTEPACSGSGPSCRPYIYVCIYIILTLPRSCRNGHSWLLTVARCGRALSSFLSPLAVRVCLCVCVCVRAAKNAT